jgi:hypothetical protein
VRGVLLEREIAGDQVRRVHPADQRDARERHGHQNDERDEKNGAALTLARLRASDHPCLQIMLRSGTTVSNTR